MHASLTIPSAQNAARIGTAGATGHARASAGVQTGAMALDSSALLRGRKAVTIVHNGASYRLQATKLGKLILTK